MARTARSTAKKIGITTAALVAVVGIAAPSASAATITYKLTAGTQTTGSVPYTAKSGAIAFKDVTTNQALGCSSGTAGGTAVLGAAKPGAKIVPISKTTWTNCTGPLGLVLVPTQVGTWQINAAGKTSATGVTKGSVSAVKATVASTSAGVCAFTVAGSVDSTYNNSTHALAVKTIATSAKKLTVSAVTGCFGLINNGDIVSFSATYVTTPALAIKSN